MKTKELSEKLVNCAIDLALYSVPGMADADKDSREAYKALATDLLLSGSRKSLKRIIPFRLHQLS